MDLGRVLMVAGIGCRSGVSAEQIQAAIEAALASVEAARSAGVAEPTCPAVQPTRPMGSAPTASNTLSAIATPAAKGREPGIIAAAAARGIPLMLISQSALEAANPATLTRSEHSMAAMNVHSVAEAAAVAGAAVLAANTTLTANTEVVGDALGGAKAAPRLLGPRIAVGPVTCALADTTSTTMSPACVSADAAHPQPADTTTPIIP